MIAYKVVEKRTRWGSNWMMFKNRYACGRISLEEFTRGLKFRKRHPEIFPHYYRGRIIKAAPCSLGILCFETKKDAENFILDADFGSSATIVAVRGIGFARAVKKVLACCGAYPWRLETGSFVTLAPKGTLAFDAIKVLE